MFSRTPSRLAYAGGISFFSAGHSPALLRSCEKPRIKKAMQKESVFIEELAHTNIFYLRKFEEDASICDLYEKGYLSLVYFSRTTD